MRIHCYGQNVVCGVNPIISDYLVSVAWLIWSAGGTAYLPAGLIHCPPPPQQQQQQQQQLQTTVHELTIPNEQIGCIIGRAGCKINEIRSEVVYHCYDQ